MNILYIGDIMAEPGMQVVEHVLPKLREEHAIDLVIAQAENATNGKGVGRDDFARLRAAGVDFCTGGNHTLSATDMHPLLDDPNEPIIRPANYPADTPGQGWKYVLTPHGKVLVISLLGAIVGKHADDPVDNPLQVIDQILESQQGIARAATVVNFHGDYSSEKIIIGHYLDGRATMVVGDHWHVPTADARVLPKGTAHITDVGMCGVLNSSLGVTFDSVIPRWRDGRITKNQLEHSGPYQFNGLLVQANKQGLALKATPIQHAFSTLSA
jgi:metallophosphoesterase (TIGR00282 family)